MNLKEMNDNDLAGSLCIAEMEINKNIQLSVKLKYELEKRMLMKKKRMRRKKAK